MIEVANDILHHLFAKSSDMSSVCALEDNLSGNEIKSLQYVGGFVIRKLYTKFKFHKDSNSDFSQQCSSILFSCKIDEDPAQTCINVRDRGGLWKLSTKMQNFFTFVNLSFVMQLLDLQLQSTAIN